MSDEYILSVEEMLAADDVEYKTVPTWKVKDKKTGEMVQGYVRIRSLNAEDLIEWRDANETAKKTMGIRLLVTSLVDKDGTPIGTPKHYELFKKKSNAIQERIVAAVVKLNGLVQKNEQQVCPTCKTKFPVQTGGSDDAKND